MHIPLQFTNAHTICSSERLREEERLPKATQHPGYGWATNPQAQQYCQFAFLILAPRGCDVGRRTSAGPFLEKVKLRFREIRMHVLDRAVLRTLDPSSIKHIKIQPSQASNVNYI